MDELNDILRELCLGDLIILEQILTMKDNEIGSLRKFRDKIRNYPELYNAYCAAKVLVEDPICNIKSEIINRI